MADADKGLDSPRTLFEKIWDAHVVRPATADTPAILYVDLHDSMQLLQSYFGLSGQKIPPDVEANLKPLDCAPSRMDSR